MTHLRELSVIIGTVLIKFFAQIMQVGEAGKHLFFAMFIIVMFLPELAVLFNKDFRLWLKNGVEDNDGQFNKSDFSTMLTHYATLWCIRMWTFAGLVEIFYGIQVREVYVVGALAGGFGIEMIGFFMGKRGKE